MRTLAALCGALLVNSCTSTPPVVSCTADTDCSGGAGRCLNRVCHDRSCSNVTCGAAQVCLGGTTCVDETCVDVTCSAGQECAKGSCYATTCGGVNCPSGQICANDACVDATCVGVICPTGQTCRGGACIGATANCGDTTCGTGLSCDPDTMTCVEPSCVGVHCDAGTCSNGSCPVSLCAGAVCDGGTTCDVDAGQCVTPACVGVRCGGDGGVCSQGACVDQCSVSCAAPCPQCADGRSCGGAFECQSHLCKGVCVDCDTASNSCPNAGLCQAGICRSDVLGPCNSTLDCKPNAQLTCENGTCHYTAGAMCSSDAQCISSLACENLVCQQPKCILAAYQSAVVPGLEATFEAEAYSESAQGEVFVTHAQGYGGGTQTFRRFRVELADAGVVEQVPTMPPLLHFDVNEPVAEGHADSPGTAQGTYPAEGPNQYFWWYQAGGAFDGLKTLTIQFTGFDNDVSGNFNNGGRFAKCGDSFYFIANALGGTPVILKYTAPNPLGSGTTGQTMTQHTKRRDTWPMPRATDIGCTASWVYVLGAETANGSLELARLDPATLATDVVWQLGTVDGTQGVGDWALLVASDALQYAVFTGNGRSYQVVDGGSLELSAVGNGVTGIGVHDDTGFSVYRAGTPTSTSSTVTWFRRERMDGTVPPLTLHCQYQ